MRYRTSPHIKALIEARRQYPFRCVRTHSTDPRPEKLVGYEPFARYVLSGGDEWLFTTRADRQRFLAEHGGTLLGE